MASGEGGNVRACGARGANLLDQNAAGGHPQTLRRLMFVYLRCDTPVTPRNRVRLFREPLFGERSDRLATLEGFRT